VAVGVYVDGVSGARRAMSTTVWITLVTGELGSGKTMRTAIYMVERLVAGGIVWSNIQLNKEAVDKSVGEGVIDWGRYRKLEIDEVMRCYESVPRSSNFAEPVLLVLDEVAEYFDSYDDGTTGDIRKFCAALRHLRKWGVEIRILMQHRDLIQRRIRLLAQRELCCFDGRTFRYGPIGLPLLPPYCFMLGMAEYDKLGKLRRGSRHYMYPAKEYWGWYVTREDHTKGLNKGSITSGWAKGKKMTKGQVRLLFAALVMGIAGMVGVAYAIHAIKATEQLTAKLMTIQSGAVSAAEPMGQGTNGVYTGEVRHYGKGVGRDAQGRVFVLKHGEVYPTRFKIRRTPTAQAEGATAPQLRGGA